MFGQLTTTIISSLSAIFHQKRSEIIEHSDCSHLSPAHLRVIAFKHIRTHPVTEGRDGNRTEPEPNPNRTKTLIFERTEPNSNPLFTNLTRTRTEQNPSSHRTRTEPNPNNEGSFPSLELPLCLPKIWFLADFLAVGTINTVNILIWEWAWHLPFDV